MGKSAPACFKILACGSRSVDRDDLQATDSKNSGDRRGWSFRKRSARHRVLTDSVGQEIPVSVNKENQESKAVNFQVDAGLDVTEKAPVVQLSEEKSVPSTQQDSKLSDIVVANEDSCVADGIFDEASVIIIQASIRGFLAKRDFLKEKEITKLQAAIRGHLVRTQAVGALRCVQAIIRIQALVRTHRAGLLLDGSGDSAKQAKKEDEPNARYTYVSIEKLLTNAFANQLMESMPRSKSISIKCEPLKSDSWKWLERWTSVSTVSKEQQESGSVATETYDENLEDSDAIHKNEPTPSSLSESTLVTSELGGLANASEDGSKPIAYHSNGINLEPRHPGSDVTETGSAEMIAADMDNMETAKSLSKEESGSEVLEAETKVLSAEEPKAEVKRFSRKASNPAFIAVQSKFEDLTSAAAPVKSASFSSYDATAKSNSDQYSSVTDQAIKSSRDKVLTDGVISAVPPLRIGGSECGTELSISSTLDSSDGSEFGVIEIRPETGVPYETNPVKCQEVEPAPSNADAKISEESPQLEITPVANQMSSPDNSPRSHMSQVTVPESQATPSSQVSAAKLNKKSRSEKGDSHSKGRPMITDKRPHSNLNPDSASRNSMEHSQEHKSRRAARSSFGSAKHDHKDQDPRDNTSSSSSSSLPGYMQATESAKAKAIANGSPRSSPDLQDKEIYIKKRHSLPVSSERHGSPCIQRSLSQAQENAKGSNSQSPQERKWRR